MKPRPAWAATVLVLAMATAGAAVSPGDSREAVLAELGLPSGHIRIGGEELLYFEGATVRLRNGVVVAADVRPPEVVRARPGAGNGALQRARMPVPAAALPDPNVRLREMVATPEFQLLSPEEQIAALGDFAAQNPGANILGYVLAARRRLDEQERLRRRMREIEEELNRLATEARRRQREPIWPATTVVGGTLIHRVRPWTVGWMAEAEGPGWSWRVHDCRHPAGRSAGAPLGTSGWPYNFGMGTAPVRAGPRQPGMGW